MRHRAPAPISFVPAAFVIAALSLSFGLSPASAGDRQVVSAGPSNSDAPLRLTVDDAVAMAKERNPEVLRATADLDAARGRSLQLRARPEPRLSMATEGVPYGLRDFGSTELSLGIEQPFEFPGKRALRARIGRSGEDLAGLEMERVRLRVGARAKRAYWRAVLGERTVTELEGLSGLLDQIVEASRTRFQAGSATYGDVLRARVEGARLRNSVIDEARERDLARSDLSLLLGGRSGDPLVLLTDLAFVPFDRSVEEARAAARSASPSLRIAAARAEQAGLAAKLASLNRRPDFSLGLYAPSIKLGAWGVGVGVSLPLSKSRTEGERLEAAAGREAERVSAEAEGRRIDAAVDTAYAAVRAAATQVRTFEDTLISEIDEEIRSGLNQFRYGRMDSLALLDLYRTYVTAKVERLKALALYLSALADLEAAGETD